MLIGYSSSRPADGADPLRLGPWRTHPPHLGDHRVRRRPPLPRCGSLRLSLLWPARHCDVLRVRRRPAAWPGLDARLARWRAFARPAQSGSQLLPSPPRRAPRSAQRHLRAWLRWPRHAPREPPRRRSPPPCWPPCASAPRSAPVAPRRSTNRCRLPRRRLPSPCPSPSRSVPYVPRRLYRIQPSAVPSFRRLQGHVPPNRQPQTRCGRCHCGVDQTPTASSRSLSDVSRCPSSRCRCGTLRRQPTKPKSRLSALLVTVMLTAWPSRAMENG